MAHTCNPGTWKVVAQTIRSSKSSSTLQQIQGQPKLHETMSQNKTKIHSNKKIEYSILLLKYLCKLTTVETLEDDIIIMYRSIFGKEESSVGSFKVSLRLVDCRYP